MKKIFFLVAISMVASFATAQVADQAISKQVQDLLTNQKLQGDVYSSNSMKLLLSGKGMKQVMVFKGQDERANKHLIFKRADATTTPMDLAFSLNHGSGMLFPPFFNVKNYGTQIVESAAQQMVASAGSTTAVIFSAEALKDLIAQPNVAGLVFIPLQIQGFSSLAVAPIHSNGQPILNGTILHSPEVAMPYPTPLANNR